MVAPADEPEKTKEVKVALATADVNPEEQPLEAIYDDKTDKKRVTGPVAYAIDGKDETAWGIDSGPGRRNVPRKAVFVLEEPVEFASGTLLKIKLVQNHGGWNSDDNQTNNLGRFRFSVTSEEGVEADPLPADVRRLVGMSVQDLSEQQALAIFRYWRTTVPEWKEANDRIESLWKQHPEGSSQLVLSEVSESRKTSLLERGDFLKPVDEVKPGVPGFLNPLPEGEEEGRLSFARWLVDRQSPTTPRAIVNRVWQTYFGTGTGGDQRGLRSYKALHPRTRSFSTGWRPTSWTGAGT